MIKCIVYILIFLFLGTMLVFALNDNNNDIVGYPDGKDTVESFDQGRFQIMRCPDKTLDFDALDYTLGVIDSEISYRIIDDKVYMKGIVGYTIFNITTNEIKQYVIYEGYSESERIEMEELHEEIMNEIPEYTRIKSYEDFSEQDRAIFAQNE